MSIASQLQALEGNIEDAYDMVAQRGGTMPQRKNMENLDDAIATIPSATTPGDGTLTIQKNGTTVATFTANQSANTTANISVQENSTMFYGKADTLPGEAGLVIYNNATRTTQTTWQQFADALQAGPVSITFDGDVLDHPYPIAVIYSEVYGGSVSFIVESAGASYTYTWYDTDTEPGTPTTKRYQPLLTAGSNISISSNTISATDTTYSDFTGTDGMDAGAAGLVPAPATTDINKYLSSNGSWVSIPDRSSVEFYWFNNDLYTDNMMSDQVDPSDVAALYEYRPLFIYNPSNTSHESIVSINGGDSINAVTMNYGSGDTVVVQYRYDYGNAVWTRLETNVSYSDFAGATSSTAGSDGLVPAPAAGGQNKVLTGAGTWSKVGNDNIDWSTVPSTYTECTTTGAQKTPSSGNCKICKIGKIVNLQVNYNYSGTKVFDLARFGDVIIADIPAGYRPQFNIYGAAMVKCSSSTVGTDQFNQIHLWVNSTGALLINNMGEGALTGVAAIRGNLTWFVA